MMPNLDYAEGCERLCKISWKAGLGLEIQKLHAGTTTVTAFSLKVWTVHRCQLQPRAGVLLHRGSFCTGCSLSCRPEVWPPACLAWPHLVWTVVVHSGWGCSESGSHTANGEHGCGYGESQGYLGDVFCHPSVCPGFPNPTVSAGYDL